MTTCLKKRWYKPRQFVVFAVAFLVSAAALAAAPDERPRRAGGRAQNYSIEQAISDQAQLHTIAFNCLAFVSGDFGASTFLPPGKVCDYFGFQYMRDIDAQGAGHNPKFLNRAAGNVLAALTDEQRSILVNLACEQAPQLNDLALSRLPLIMAFHRQLAADIPAGSQGLNQLAVSAHVGQIFELDGRLSLQRAQAYGKIIATLSEPQKSRFAGMKFGDFATWPDVDANSFRLPRGTEKRVNVAYMTYASEFFSWYAGSVEADTYFCPERHGTYFGGFYMKDIPAMGKKDFDISTSVTGDGGKAFLDLLDPRQRALITHLLDQQRGAMREIVSIRRAISMELRKVINGTLADEKRMLELARQYGEHDGKVSCEYAIAFAKVGRSLTPKQTEAVRRLRNLDGYTSAAAYLYSSPMFEVPPFGNTDRFFFPPQPEAGDRK